MLSAKILLNLQSSMIKSVTTAERLPRYPIKPLSTLAGTVGKLSTFTGHNQLEGDRSDEEPLGGRVTTGLTHSYYKGETLPA
jgi:hypothetical protein